jgi:hypothetical protein
MFFQYDCAYSMALLLRFDALGLVPERVVKLVPTKRNWCDPCKDTTVLISAAYVVEKRGCMSVIDLTKQFYGRSFSFFRFLMFYIFI